MRGVPELAEADQSVLCGPGGNPRPPGDHAWAQRTEREGTEAHGTSIHIHVDVVAAARHAVSAELSPAGAALIAFTEIHRSEEHTSELQSLMRISYAVFCL